MSPWALEQAHNWINKSKQSKWGSGRCVRVCVCVWFFFFYPAICTQKKEFAEKHCLQEFWLHVKFGMCDLLQEAE